MSPTNNRTNAYFTVEVAGTANAEATPPLPPPLSTLAAAAALVLWQFYSNSSDTAVAVTSE